ncbi:hypothetical protein [Candidatus Pristimantibacillus sp. PTI5]|uniref:hypothetical protein n=1 Tax=Candidatus Pristimantibacillus sp. PTI5 TaxID=3400422 RepID=UPI003B012894
MTQAIRSVPGAAVRGTASGVLFMSFFGTLWAYTGTMGLRGWGTSLFLTAALVIGAALFFGGISLIRSSKALPVQSIEGDARTGKRMRFWFNINFAAEGIAIFIAIAVCNAIHRSELMPIIIAIIVGIHFFPLASLFGVKFYHFTGAFLCLLAVITWLFVPERITVGSHQLDSYLSIVGFGSSIILWITGFAIWMTGRRLLTGVPREQTSGLSQN